MQTRDLKKQGFSHIKTNSLVSPRTSLGTVVSLTKKTKESKFLPFPKDISLRNKLPPKAPESEQSSHESQNDNYSKLKPNIIITPAENKKKISSTIFVDSLNLDPKPKNELLKKKESNISSHPESMRFQNYNSKPSQSKLNIEPSVSLTKKDDSNDKSESSNNMSILDERKEIENPRIITNSRRFSAQPSHSLHYDKLSRGLITSPATIDQNRISVSVSPQRDIHKKSLEKNTSLLPASFEKSLKSNTSLFNFGGKKGKHAKAATTKEEKTHDKSNNDEPPATTSIDKFYNLYFFIF